MLVPLAGLLLLPVMIVSGPTVSIFCEDEEELGETDEAGLANRTPSYWTPLNSIETTSCWSPLEASPRLISLNCIPIIPLVTAAAAAADEVPHDSRGDEPDRFGRS